MHSAHSTIASNSLYQFGLSKGAYEHIYTRYTYNVIPKQALRNSTHKIAMRGPIDHDLYDPTEAATLEASRVYGIHKKTFASMPGQRVVWPNSYFQSKLTYKVCNYYKLYEKMASHETYGHRVIIAQTTVTTEFYLPLKNSYLLYDYDMQHFICQIGLTVQSASNIDILNATSISYITINNATWRYNMSYIQKYLINRIKYLPNCSIIDYLYVISCMYEKYNNLNISHFRPGQHPYIPSLIKYTGFTLKEYISFMERLPSRYLFSLSDITFFDGNTNIINAAFLEYVLVNAV